MHKTQITPLEAADDKTLAHKNSAFCIKGTIKKLQEGMI